MARRSSAHDTPRGPLRALVIARDPAAYVQAARVELEQFLASRPAVRVVDVWGKTAASARGRQKTGRGGDVPPVVPDITHGAEVAFVVGGDGAILRACRAFGNEQIPILGINRGRLGFLADLSLEEFKAQFDLIERREFRVASHLMFECVHERADGRTSTYVGMNEVLLSAAASLEMIDVELSINGRVATVYSGDGVLISTPVGSTAHSLSAGGPILAQELEAFVITPICPHTLTNRPLVDQADQAYTLTIPDAPKGVMLVIDGQIKTNFQRGDKVLVRRAPVRFQLARLPGHSYYGTLHRKLQWGGQPNYGPKG